LKKLDELFEKAKINEQVDELEQRFRESVEKGTNNEIQILIQQSQKLFKKVTKFMKCAEKKAAPSPIGMASQIHPD
jgi:Ni,Fe-hydrogenase III component G